MINELINSISIISTQTVNNLTVLSLILVIPWVTFFITYFITNKILLLGIIPRHFFSILGIFFAPLLHANFNHIFFNSIPLLVLSDFILINGLHYYFTITLFIIILSGFAIWCFAKDGLHIGASALITGYWGLLISNVYQQGTLTTIVLGLVSIYYFAGIFFSIFPRKKGVSWEGHLFGLLAGFATSYIVQFYPSLILQ